MAPRADQRAREQALGQDHRRHGRDVGAMPAPGDQAPVDALGRAVPALAFQRHGHAAHVRAQEPQRVLQRSAAARPAARAGAAARRGRATTGPTVPDGRRRLRARRNTARCAGPDSAAAADRGRACRTRRASARRGPEWSGAAGSASRATDRSASRRRRRDRPPERAQDRLRGGKAGIEAVAGRYDDGGRLQRGKPRRVLVDHCGGDAPAPCSPRSPPARRPAWPPHRARRCPVTNSRASARSTIVRARGDARPRQPVVLPLVGSRCVDHQQRPQRRQIVRRNLRPVQPRAA